MCIRDSSRTRSASGLGGAGRRVARVFGDAGGLTGAVAQVVQLRAANGAPHGDFDLVDAGGVHGEDALDADAVGHLAHGERLAVLPTAPAEDGALEDLDAFLVAPVSYT